MMSSTTEGKPVSIPAASIAIATRKTSLAKGGGPTLDLILLAAALACPYCCIIRRISAGV